MKLALLALVMMLVASAAAQEDLPALADGTVIDKPSEFRHEGLLRISGHVTLKGITLDLRGPIRVDRDAELELDDVHLKVADPPGSANGTSNLRCEGPARITIRHSTMSVAGSAHPIWWLQGDVTVDGFETANSEFHLDHARANLSDFSIFELEISRASKVIGNHLRLVFLSTHTGDDEKLSFSDIPSEKAFSKKLVMGSSASADLTDTIAQLFLIYVHGKSDVSLNRIGRAQLSIAPSCHGKLSLPHGIVGSPDKPVIVPSPGASDCPFRLSLREVNADTWDVYAGDEADLTLTGSVIDELTANGHAKVVVSNSEIYADWLSLAGDAQLRVDHSTVGAQRLAAQRPDLATSQVRLNGHSQASFDHVRFDCGILGADDSVITIQNSSAPPKYIWRAGHANIKTVPPLTVEDVSK